jgi:hypothetical protein
MSPASIGVVLAFAALLVKLVMDWRDHDQRKRRFSIGLGLIGLVSAVVAFVGVLKNGHDATDLNRQMVELRQQLEITNKPKPPAVLQVGLIDPTLGAPVRDPASEMVAPVEGDHITIALTIANNSDVTALNGMLAVRLCDGCAYEEEPKDFVKPFGAVDVDRQYRFQRLEPGTSLERRIIKVAAPLNAGQAGFMIATKVWCDNCGPPKKDFDYFRVMFGAQTAQAAK